MRRELTRGAVAGAVGGAAMAVVLLVAGEGPLQRAIDREPATGGLRGPNAVDSEELVSRAGQRIGGVIAVVLVGVALGLVLAFVGEILRRRRASGDGDAEPWWASLRLAVLAFAVITLVPFLKYPPNPPGIGDSDTIGTRTGAFLALLAWSVLVAWAAGRAWRWFLRRDVPVPLAAPAVVAAAIALIALAYVVLPPAPNPDALPVRDVWDFRLASLAGWAAYWAVAGTVLSWLRLPVGALGRARLGGVGTPV